jgi:hypothetical protein
MPNSERTVRIAALATAGAIIGSALALKHWGADPAMLAIVAIVPVPFYIGFVVITIRHIRELDGLQQRIALEAMTFAATLTGLAALAYGQLEYARVLPPANIGLVAPILMLLYALGHVVACRRYR